MKVLVAAHSPCGSGSDTTIRRIAAHIESSGHSVLFAADHGDPGTVSRLARRHRVDAMIGTHALLCARSFRDEGPPYVVVFGGTDLNEYALDPPSLEAMGRAVNRAAGLVAFTTDFVDRCLALWPHVRDRLRHVPQGVHTEPSRSFSLKERLRLPSDARMLLLPSGLRPVKDPLLLLRCVSRWHQEDPRIHLVIAGLTYDQEFAGIVRRRCAASSGLHYIGVLRRADLQAAMLESTAVLNTSLSECSPNALLEAMRLGCPVVARDIPGNTCLVRHEATGLVFDDPEGFRRQVHRLLDDPPLARRLGRQAQRYTVSAHSMEAERTAYARLIGDLAHYPGRDDLVVSHATTDGRDA